MPANVSIRSLSMERSSLKIQAAIVVFAFRSVTINKKCKHAARRARQPHDRVAGIVHHRHNCNVIRQAVARALARIGHQVRVTVALYVAERSRFQSRDIRVRQLIWTVWNSQIYVCMYAFAVYIYIYSWHGTSSPKLVDRWRDLGVGTTCAPRGVNSVRRRRVSDQNTLSFLFLEDRGIKPIAHTWCVGLLGGPASTASSVDVADISLCTARHGNFATARRRIHYYKGVGGGVASQPSTASHHVSAVMSMRRPRQMKADNIGSFPCLYIYIYILYRHPTKPQLRCTLRRVVDASNRRTSCRLHRGGEAQRSALTTEASFGIGAAALAGSDFILIFARFLICRFARTGRRIFFLPYAG